MAKMIEVRMLKDGNAFTTCYPNSYVEYKANDVLEFSADFVDDMIKNGVCRINTGDIVEEQEQLEQVFDLATAKKPELVAKAAELGIDPTVNGKDKTVAVLREEIEAELKPKGITVQDDEEEIDIEMLDRDGLIQLIAEEGLDIQVKETDCADEIRTAIMNFYDELAPENKMLKGAVETK